MVLGVDGEHAGLADEKVVDVAAATEIDAVQHVPPATAEPVEFPPDLPLPARRPRLPARPGPACGGKGLEPSPAAADYGSAAAWPAGPGPLLPSGPRGHHHPVTGSAAAARAAGPDAPAQPRPPD